MGMTQTEKLGFGKNVMELVEVEAPLLRKAGHDADAIHGTMAKGYERAAEANARQEEMKRGLKAQTVETVAATNDFYRMSSGYLDVLIAAAGKGTEKAKNFQRLRSRVRMPNPEGEAATTVEPVHEAPK